MTENEIIEQLSKIQKENLIILGKLRTKLQAGTKIKGHLRIYRRGKQFFYYLISNKGDSNGTYLPKGNTETIAQLSQRDYSTLLLSTLIKNTKTIRSFIKHYTPAPLDTTFHTLHPGKQPFITPVKPTTEQFIATWKSQKFPIKNFHPDSSKFFSSSGLRVRSKSEIIIANTLEKYDIPYHYERPLKITGAITLHPDFTCLNPRTCQEFIWEHFGLMDSPEYANNAVEKIQLYQSKNFFLGKNLIVTFETLEFPIQPSQVETIVKAFLQ